MNQKLKNKKGITLIALVVTIVVLLILAGVSINLILDNNGIIAKAQDAKIETRASQVENEIGLWEQNNFINSEAGQEQEDIDNLLASLISRKLLTEDEIDRERGIITIKKSDGTIIKEISYSNVKISISREPETTEKVGTVVFTIDSVEGIRKVNASQGESEIDNFISSLSEEQQKEMIKRSEHLCINKDMAEDSDNPTNYTTFKEALEWYKESGDILEATEEAFWDWVGNADDIAEWLKWNLDYVGFYDIEGNLVCCVVTNPDNEISNSYVAAENGTYAFKVQDIITGRTYIKKVEVTNILVVEPENIGDWEYTEEDDGTITITGYCGTATEVIIPNSINGKKVKRIYKGRNDLTTMGDQVSIWEANISSSQRIGRYSGYTAAQDTITKIKISDGIEEIGSCAFLGTTELTEVELPNSLKKIEQYAFYCCYKLEKVQIPDNVTSIESGAFSSCYSLTDIVIPDNITTIGNEAFDRCTNLSQITIPQSVENIGDYAFTQCTNLTNITIPENVISLGKAVFMYIPSITVNVPFKEGEQPSGWDTNWNQTSSDCTITVNYAK